MDYTTLIDILALDPCAQRQSFPSDDFSLSPMFRTMDNIQFTTAVEDLYDNLPAYWMTNAGPPTDCTYGPVCDYFGELAVPESPPHELCHDSFNSYLNCPQQLEPAPYTPPLDCSVPSGISHDPPDIGYSDLSSYGTDWEWNVNLHSNSRHILHGYHTDIEMPNSSISNSNVMQHYQELDHSSASGCLYTQSPRETLSHICGSETTKPSHQSPPAEALSSPFPLTPQTSEPSPLSSVCSSLLTPQDSGSPLPFCPSSPALHFIPATIEPQPSGKKRARASKKAILIPEDERPKVKSRRKSPGGRPAIRSQEWLDLYFPNKRSCTLCGGGPADGRADRALEHLASTHIFQPVKNLDVFDAELLTRATHQLIQTEAQYAFVRSYIDSVRCTLCPRNTSLVVREENIKKHLATVHRSIPQSAQNEELKRVEGLRLNRKDWYSFHDAFLYKLSLVR